MRFKKLTLFFVLIISSVFFCACKKEDEEIPVVNDYDVIGVWYASYSWHQDNPYNYGGDTYKMEAWMEFFEDGTTKDRSAMSLNGVKLSDTDWVIAPYTYDVCENEIILSSGKSFIIVNDQFDIVYEDMVFHYKKIESVVN